MSVSMDAKPSIRHHFCALKITSVSTFLNFVSSKRTSIGDVQRRVGKMPNTKRPDCEKQRHTAPNNKLSQAG